MYNIHDPHKEEPKVAPLFCHSCIFWSAPIIGDYFPSAGMTTASAPCTGRAGRAAPVWWTCSSWGGLASTSWTGETTRLYTWLPATDIVTSWERYRFPIMFDKFHMIRVIKMISFLHHLGFSATKSLGQHGDLISCLLQRLGTFWNL